MKLRNRLLWGVTSVVGLNLLVAFMAFSDGDVKLSKLGTSGGNIVKKLIAGAAGQNGNELRESQEHSNTDERSNKTVPKIPGQRIIPTTPEMRQMIEWLAAQMDQVPKKPPREMGNRLLDVSNTSASMSGDERPLWETFHMEMRRHEVYPAASDLPDNIMKHLAESEIINAVPIPQGTQLKVLFTLKDGAKAVFKPQRFPRDKSDTLPDHLMWDDMERHFAEIAAFHLDRLLGFRRAPPVVGRKVNVSSDIKAYADKEFLETFFWSPANNLCFYGNCQVFCSTAFAACGDPYMLEGSMGLVLALPRRLKAIWHPWVRSYYVNGKAKWESNPDYCDIVKKRYDPKNRRIWDFMDLSVLDFLIGNLDRHNYVEYLEFGNDSSLIHYDMGKGFGKPYNDDLTCLQPIIHCCMIRRTTLAKLLTFYHGPVSLASQMKAAMAHESVAPVLLDKHYNALDRRVPIILHEVAKCVKQKGLFNVIQDDGF